MKLTVYDEYTELTAKQYDYINRKTKLKNTKIISEAMLKNQVDVNNNNEVILKKEN